MLLSVLIGKTFAIVCGANQHSDLPLLMRQGGFEASRTVPAMLDALTSLRLNSATATCTQRIEAVARELRSLPHGLVPHLAQLVYYAALIVPKSQAQALMLEPHNNEAWTLWPAFAVAFIYHIFAICIRQEQGIKYRIFYMPFASLTHAAAAAPCKYVPDDRKLQPSSQ